MEIIIIIATIFIIIGLNNIDNSINELKETIEKYIKYYNEQRINKKWIKMI